MFEKETKYSVAIASKMLGIETPNVCYVDSRFLHGSSITSMYVPNLNIILFNKDWLVSAKIEEVILTSFHETRHSYQKSQINGLINTRYAEKRATIETWKREFEQYFRPSDQYQDDPRYLEQEIEKDAIRFAHMLLKELGQ